MSSESSSYLSSNSSSSSTSEDEAIKLEAKKASWRCLIVLLSKLLKNSLGRQPNSTSTLIGSAFIQELLNGSSSVCYELMWMDK